MILGRIYFRPISQAARRAAGLSTGLRLHVENPENVRMITSDNSDK
jgi:hypothetical protein